MLQPIAAQLFLNRLVGPVAQMFIRVPFQFLRFANLPEPCA